jgi:Xaa-Pro aminopeptidase
VTAYLDGVHGDTNATFLVGNVREEARLLVERTHEAMMRGIKAVAPGRPLNAIGRVIEAYAKRFNYGVVRDFTGHGIGESFHSGLYVPHYDSPRLNVVMEPGMTFTIEPMSLGTFTYDIWPTLDGVKDRSAPPSSSTPCWSPRPATRSSPCRNGRPRRATPEYPPHDRGLLIPDCGIKP